MATFLFWNINKRPIGALIVKLVHDHDVDVLILAESDIVDAELLTRLNRGERAKYFPAPNLSKRLRIYTRYHPQFIKPIKDAGGISILHLILPLRKDILLVAVHLASKTYQTDLDQTFISVALAREIERAEKKVGHSRTILVGDLNMNPFENGVVAANGLHAVMDRHIAQRGFRRVQGQNRRFFYNPMWNCLGDMPPGPPGTYYFDTGKQINFFWYMLDQVLIRPELLDAFQKEELNILTEVGPTSLLASSGKPDKKVGSDHFPILFRLNL